MVMGKEVKMMAKKVCSEGHLEDNGRGKQNDAGSCMSKIRAAMYNRSALRERCMLVSFE